MSARTYQVIEKALEELLEAHATDPNTKLTYRALAARAGCSVSTINEPEYRTLREQIKAAKSKQPQVETNADAAEWRRRYYQLQKESAGREAALREELKGSQATLDRMVQKLQLTALPSGKAP